MTGHQRRVEAIRAAVVSISAEYRRAPVAAAATRLPGPHAVQGRLRQLAGTVRRECLMLSPVTVRGDGAADARRPVYQGILERGVSLRAIHTGNGSDDPATRSLVRWLTGLGAHVRTAPAVALYLVVVDSEAALVPLDPARPHLGAVEVRHPGVVADIRALYEQVWTDAPPFGPVGAGPALTETERTLLRLLGDGHTDESAGRKLGMSVRTVRRMMASLSDRLGARSRFQAGLLAAHHGWL